MEGYHIFMPDPAALLQLLRQTRSLLAAHAAFGLSGYPAAPELRRFAAGRTEVPLPPPARLPQQRTAPAEKKTEPAQPQALALNEIVRQLADCRRCPEAAPQPGLGGVSPQLMAVSDCFVGSGRGQGQLWGEEEDALFWRMMAKIELDRNAVYVTNVVKCAQQALPLADGSVQSCLFWLEQELLSLRPALLCALGETAAWLLTGRKVPLMRLRGRFHPCRLPTAPQAQVLVTYHPRLLLQQRDLRWIALEDLQLLQRWLAAGPV